jgi:hypothetical protein
MPENQLLNKTMEILSSYLGDMVAKSSIKLHCGRLGIAPEALDKAMMPSMAAEMLKGLSIFVGAEKAKVIAEQLSTLEG